jgi:hypothetical protein
MPRPDRSPAGSDRAAKVAQIQKAGAAAERRRGGLIWGAVALVLTLIVGLVAWAIIRDSPALVDLGGVEEYENSARDHTTAPVEYEVIPPYGGEHHPTWFNCGVYQEELPTEHVVHSLEHGAVWLTYQPDLPAEQVAVLEELGEQEYMMVSPLAAQDSPVVATSWDTQLRLDEAEERTLQAFIREYRQGAKTPEPGALCSNGTTIDLVPRG